MNKRLGMAWLIFIFNLCAMSIFVASSFKDVSKEFTYMFAIVFAGFTAIIYLLAEK
jgi:hypothetical protein